MRQRLKRISLLSETQSAPVGWVSEALPITTRIQLAQPDGNGQNHTMTDYRRNRVPNGTYFFTVNLADRRSNLLVRHIDALRDAVRQLHASAPFHIDA